jgi:hypothetical protein
MPALLSILVVLLATFPALADVDVFTTPSRNIQCTMGLGDSIPSDIDCTIFEHTGPPPTPGPACKASGYEFSMRERGPVTVKCGRTAPDSIDNAVKYGSTVKYEGIACRSSTNGLECRNADGHGFFLSRARQSVF